LKTQDKGLKLEIITLQFWNGFGNLDIAILLIKIELEIMTLTLWIEIEIMENHFVVWFKIPNHDIDILIKMKIYIASLLRCLKTQDKVYLFNSSIYKRVVANFLKGLLLK